MAYPETVAPKIVGVWYLNEYLRKKIAIDSNLQLVSVRGEITNLVVASTGHCFFDLKELDALLNCVAFATTYATFPKIKNGSAIVATGTLAIRSQRSSFQLNVNKVELEGLGNIATLFDERKRKLEADGLFAEEKKKKLPAYPFRIALVSSPSSDGAIDFTTILGERAPHVAIVWCKTSVQGAKAPPEIVDALKRASQADVDAIVITRGGGSFEDLFVFSDEQVVRAVACARHPVLSAIGHTVNQQLCDFAADVHVETPSAAAERIAPSTLELRAYIADRVERGRKATDRRLERLEARLGRALLRSRLASSQTFLIPVMQRLDEVDRRLQDAVRVRSRDREERLRAVERRLSAHDPSQRLAERAGRLQALAMRLDAAGAARGPAYARRVADLSARLVPAIGKRFERANGRLELALAHLNGKDPAAILQRGYAIVTYENAIVRDASAVPAGARIEARVARGTLAARVESDGADGN